MTTTEPQRYQLDDLDEHELALLMDFRARRYVQAEPAHRRPRRRTRVDTWLYAGTGLLLVVMLVAALPRALESIGVPLPLDATPLPSTPVPAPEARRTAPDARQGYSGERAPEPTANTYTLTVPSAMRGAWAPDQPAALDVTGRAYRLLDATGGWQHVELDDGTRLWLTDPSVAPWTPPTTTAPAVVEPTWGPGGTSGGATWDEPPAQPAHVEHAIIPALPFLEAPEPTWGPGGSSGGATW
jgi:hypothetical protein